MSDSRSRRQRHRLRRYRTARRLCAWARRNIAPLALVMLVVCSFRSAIADWNVVPSGSMNPTIVEGDRILVNKLAFGVRVPFTMWHLADWAEPGRGDVIIFHSPVDGQRLVKRVVGLPGETVELINNRLFINGRPAFYQLTEPGSAGIGHVLGMEQIDAGGATHPVLITPSLPSRRTFGPVTVPPGQYFVLGDNRDNSGDSRYFGFVPLASITGRASRVAYSLDPDDGYLPRLNRTLEPLP